MMILQTNRGASCFFEVSDVSIPGNYEIKMLQKNTFKYVPPTEIREIDGKRSLYVKIDGLGTLINRFQKNIPDKKDLEKLLLSIKGCMTELKDYMLEPGGIVIDMEHILYSPGDDNYKFMYVPGSNLSFRDQMKNLFEEIMRIFDHKDRDGVVYLYDIYSHFLMDNFTPDIFCKLIKGNEGVTSKAKLVQQVEQSQNVNGFTIDEPMILQDSSIQSGSNIESINGNNKHLKTDMRRNILMVTGAVIVSVIMYLILGTQSLMISAVLALIMAAYIGVDMIRKKEEEETRLSMEPVLPVSLEVSDRNPDWEFGNDPDINNEDAVVDTTVLSEEDSFENRALGISKLIPCNGNNEKPILLIEGETRVGRVHDVCDICIDSPEISRVHAILEKKGKEVLVKDVGSTNGTYLNEHKLKKEKSEKLNPGDVISMAGFMYECR